MRNILSLILSAVLCFSFVSCAPDTSESAGGITAMQRPKNSISASLGAEPLLKIFCGDTNTLAFKVTGSNLTADSFCAVTSDPNVLDIELDGMADGYVYCKLTAKAVGEAVVYLEFAGGSPQSEFIKILVAKKTPEYIVAAVSGAELSLVEGRIGEICFAVLGCEPYLEDVCVTVSDGSVLKAAFDRISGNYVYYLLEGISHGKTEVRLETADGKVKSDSITVTVIERAGTSVPGESQAGFITSKNSSTFHTPTCSFVGQINDENKIFFECDREEMIEAGYVPCKKCNP